MPFGSLIAFFGIYIGIVNNTKFSRFVRFNAMQVGMASQLVLSQEAEAFESGELGDSAFDQACLTQV